MTFLNMRKTVWNLQTDVS